MSTTPPPPKKSLGQHFLHERAYIERIVQAVDLAPGERLVEIGLPDFGPEIKLSCANHGGSGMSRIQQWDATAKKWNLITEFTAPDAEVLDPLVAEDAAAYAKENNLTERSCN